MKEKDQHNLLHILLATLIHSISREEGGIEATIEVVVDSEDVVAVVVDSEDVEVVMVDTEGTMVEGLTEEDRIKTGEGTISITQTTQAQVLVDMVIRIRVTSTPPC